MCCRVLCAVLLWVAFVAGCCSLLAVLVDVFGVCLCSLCVACCVMFVVVVCRLLVSCA